MAPLEVVSQAKILPTAMMELMATAMLTALSSRWAFAVA